MGDAEMTERHEVLVQAAREAMLNAARHAGGGISVYVECTPGRSEVFVRDRGPGFELASVPPDRMGVRESMIGRMERHGGQARIRSSRQRHRSPPQLGTPSGRNRIVTEPIRVVVVDDHAIFRSGLKADLDERIEVVGEAGDREEADRGHPRARPDVVLLDVHLPGGRGGGGPRWLPAARPCWARPGSWP